MAKFQNQEMRFDLDPETGTVLQIEMHTKVSGDLVDARDGKVHRIDTIEALIIPGDQLSTQYKAMVENLVNGFLIEYRTFKALS